MDPLDLKDSTDKMVLGIGHRLSKAIAVITSLVALLAATSSLMGSRCSTRGLVAKNEAIFYQGKASDQWSFFQSRNLRLEIAELSKRMTSKDVKENEEKIKRFEKERDETYLKAKEDEAQRDLWARKSNAYLDVSKTFGTALAFLQSAIILVPLTMLVEQLVILITGIALGTAGAIMLIISYAQYFSIS